jgi:hypothetical protein
MGFTLLLSFTAMGFLLSPQAARVRAARQVATMAIRFIGFSLVAVVPPAH